VGGLLIEPCRLSSQQLSSSAHSSGHRHRTSDIGRVRIGRANTQAYEARKVRQTGYCTITSSGLTSSGLRCCHAAMLPCCEVLPCCHAAMLRSAAMPPCRHAMMGTMRRNRLAASIQVAPQQVGVTAMNAWNCGICTTASTCCNTHPTYPSIVTYVPGSNR
jgi:hypothetical protein